MSETLVGRLRDLHDGPLVFHEVVRLGDAAVPALEHLVRGPSGAIHHPRSLAADALAAIRTPEAVRALIRALLDSIGRAPAAEQLEAESILVNHLAEHLSRFPGPDVTEALLTALQRRRYPYCAAALGLTGDLRAIPLLIECLYDDPARPAAMGALRGYRQAALKPLAAALLETGEAGHPEPPSRVDGRAAAARVLGELAATDPGDPPIALPALTQALNDCQRPVRVGAALALARCGAPAAEAAAGILVLALDEPNWARAEEIINALVRLGPAAERLIVPMLALRPRNEADRRRRLRLAEAAGRLGSAAAIRRLVAFHQAAEPTLRLAAVSALGRIAPADAGALALFLADPDPLVRYRALAALRRRKAVDAAEATRLLADADEDVRRLATDTIRENLGAALPALTRAARHCGAPLHGLAPRLRLWWHACALLAEKPAPHR